MNVNLELVLVIGTLLTGGIWLFDRFVWRPRRMSAALANPSAATEDVAHTAPSQAPASQDPWYVEYSKSFFPVLLIVLVVRGFVVDQFRIPSGSMMPTLLVGDFILVNKFAYGLHLPVLNTKFIETDDPKRGDVVVFRYPENPSEDYIKRVVGLPGDHITYYNKVLYINGKRCPQQLLGEYEGVGSDTGSGDELVFREKLGDVTHKMLIEPGNPSMNGEYVIPPDEYFVMGDNRDNSNDSRYWGFVPDANLIGKAFMIWLNWDLAGGAFDYTRIGEQIH
jgi:signal peptidase I